MRPFQSRQRVIEPELLEQAAPEDAARNLADLERINRWFGGHRIALSLLGSRLRTDQTFSLLDVGAASGDVAAAILRRFPRASATLIDRKPWHTKPVCPRVAADALALPFAPRSFDVVFCSLFLHHFADDAAVDLLRRFHGLARQGVVVLDLERAKLAHRFLPATRHLLHWHPITVHDGMASVQAGFHACELTALAREAGLPHPIVRRHRPWFRLSLSAWMI